jgi:glycosyltransferase involved in cell wall biosynthesis
MPTISAIVITKNEAAKLGDCLDSLAFCNEIVVVDSGSEDATVAIAEEKGARVVAHAWVGYGPQKNFALSLATGDWVLSIDADERVSAELAQQIKAAVASGDADAYEMPRLSSFCGRVMHRSGWYPDYVLRLFRRTRACFSDDIVHERLVCDGRIGRLSADLIHVPVLKLEDALARMDRYSTLGAEKMVASGRRVSFMSGITHGVWTFIRVYILRFGFLDGREGFLLAVANAEGSYYRYMKAWLEGRGRG